MHIKDRGRDGNTERERENTKFLRLNVFQVLNMGVAGEFPATRMFVSLDRLVAGVSRDSSSLSRPIFFHSVRNVTVRTFCAYPACIGGKGMVGSVLG